ncbi:MAG: HupE/UreJ family protein [Candidatus Binatia bacterium]
MSRRPALVGPELLFLLFASVARAGVSPELDAGFAAGAMHLLTEPDHLLAITALGLVAGQLGRRALLWVPVSLSAGLALGALSGGRLPPLEQVEALNSASVAILGATVALGSPLSVVSSGVLALLFAWGHGYANALDIGGKAPPCAFVLGVMAAAMLVVVFVSVTTGFCRKRWQEIAIRAVGSWICAIGLMVFALRFAGE